MSEDSHHTLRVNEETMEKIEALLKKDLSKGKKYKSKAEVVEDAVQHLSEEQKPRFTHINMRDELYLIMDWKQGDYATIILRETGAWCDKDKSLDCVHAQYAMSDPEIQKKWKEKGWRSNTK